MGLYKTCIAARCMLVFSKVWATLNRNIFKKHHAVWNLVFQRLAITNIYTYDSFFGPTIWSKQWAAVRTEFFDIKLPPQQKVFSSRP